MKPTRFLALAAFLFAGSQAQAAVVNWTDWTASDLASASGTIGGIDVDFSGTLKFAQLDPSTTVGSTTTINYWTEGSPAPYTGNSVVDNAPTPNELLAFNAASSNTLTFSSAVLNPVMALVSLGRPSSVVTYDFDSPFTVLSEGEGYWGDGTYTLGAGDVLNGYELHAVIQFSGLISQINWTSTAEDWHGFTVGVPVPLPAALPLFGTGLAVLGMFGWRRRQRSAA